MCEQRELNHKSKNVISELFHAGKKTSDIIKDTGYASQTVYRIVSNLRKGKSIKRKSHAPRADKIRKEISKWFEMVHCSKSIPINGNVG